MKLFRRTNKQQPEAQQQQRRGRPARDADGEGTNTVQHHPDPKAEPIPDGEHKYVPRSPYRTGNW